MAKNQMPVVTNRPRNAGPTNMKKGGTIKKYASGGGIGDTSIRRMRINSLDNRTDKTWKKMMNETRSSSPNQNRVNRLNDKVNRLDDRKMRLIDKEIEKDRIKGTSVMKKGGTTKSKMTMKKMGKK